LDIFREVGKYEFWPDIDQRLEYKTTSRDLRMGDGEVGFRKGNVVAVEEIDVDCAGAVSLLSGQPAKGPFDAFELIEEFLRLHFGGKFERSVEERRRFSWTVHGRSFVDLGAENRPRSGVEGEKAAAGCLEINKARLDIGPKCNSGAHVFSEKQRVAAKAADPDSPLAPLILIQERLACHKGPGVGAVPISPREAPLLRKFLGWKPCV
jgi:hypothetical protein